MQRKETLVKPHMIVIATVLPLLFIACSPGTQQQAAFKTAVDTAAIRSAGQERMTAIAAGNIDGYLAAYEDEAVWMPPQAEEIVGKAAARQRLQGVLDQVSIETEGMVDEEVVMSPEWVLIRGTYTMTRTPKGGAEAEDAVGTYLTMWHRQGDGSFKIAYDMWNSDRPLQLPSE